MSVQPEQATSVAIDRAGFGRAWRLLRFAKPYQAGWWLIATLSLAGTLVSLAQPWPMKVLVDVALDPSNGGSDRAWLIGFVALSGVILYVANAGADVMLARASVRVGQRTVYDLAGELFARVQRQSLQYHRRRPTGDTMSRVTGDCWCVYKLVDVYLLTPARALVMTLGAVVIMLPMDRRMTLVVLLTAPVMAALNVPLARRTRSQARDVREIEGRMQSHVHQTLTGIGVVQAFAREDHEQGRFRELAGRAVRAQRQGVLLNSLSGLASGAVVSVGSGAVLYFGAHRVLAGRMAVGELLVFMAYVALLYDQSKAVVNAWLQAQTLGAQVDRVSEILGTGPDLPEPAGRPLVPARFEGAVSIQDVTYGYAPGAAAIEHVTLHVRPGETVAVVGPTGAGKSTLAGLVPRFADAWSGRVALDGVDVRDLPVRAVRRQVAVVLQEPFLFPVSVAENIAYGRPGATRAEVEAAARAANAHEFVSRLPGGYDAVVGERGATLSGGERQRLSIARALLKDAPVLVLDEPTSALDAETEASVMDALRVLMRGRTTIVIAHRLSTVRNADRIVVMDRGRVCEQGTHAELIALGGLYAEMYGAGAAGRLGSFDGVGSLRN